MPSCDNRGVESYASETETVVALANKPQERHTNEDRTTDKRERTDGAVLKMALPENKARKPKDSAIKWR